MKLLLAAAHEINPLDVKAALMAGHAQHPVIVHFPIALFISSVFFDLLALWRRNSVLASVAYYNLIGAALSVPIAVATGLTAWQWQFEGAALKGNLRLHLISGLSSALLILVLCGARFRIRGLNRTPRIPYFAVAVVAVMTVALTGHLGGIVSGVEGP